MAPPSDSRLRPVRVLKGTVEGRDAVAHTFDVVDEFNGVHSGIKYAPAYVNSDGGGSFVSPRIKSVVWLMFPSTGRTPFIFACETPPKQLDEGDEAEDPNDFRQGRPVLGEGDHMLASSEQGGFVVLRGSGVLELGASMFAKRIYMPIRNTITDYFENWFAHAAGGALAWTSRREDDRHGVDKTPTEFKLDIKEFAEGSPIIKVRAGRVQEEDDQQIPFGSKDSIVAVLNINDGAKVWVDRAGNVASVTYGGVTQTYEKAVILSYATQLSRTVRGRLAEKLGDVQQEIVRGRQVTVGQTDSLDVGVLSQTVRGKHSLVVKESQLVDVGGDVARKTAGSEVHSVGSNHKMTIGGGGSRTVGQNFEDIIAGTLSVVVANMNGADFASVHKVARGKYLLQTVLDDIVLGVGPTPDSLISKVTLSLDGTIKLEAGAGTVSVELNSTGASVVTPGGEVTVDNAGNVQLGPAGPAGAVVTTLSHPVDFMTGIPIKGTGSVGAGGAPNVIAIPPSFAPKG
jgi:hypothetical protein